MKRKPPVLVLDFETASRAELARPHEWSPTIAELIKDGYLVDFTVPEPSILTEGFNVPNDEPKSALYVQQFGRALRPATTFADMDISLARIKRARNAYIHQRDEAESQPGRAHARAIGVALDGAISHLSAAIDLIEKAMEKARS